MRQQLRYRRGRATVFGSQFEIFFSSSFDD
jgi:hypothetical protein